MGETPTRGGKDLEVGSSIISPLIGEGDKGSEGEVSGGAVRGWEPHDCSQDDTEHRAPAVLLRQRSEENLLDHDSVLIAQGAIVCSRKGVEAIVQPTYFMVPGDGVVNVEWFERLGNCGYSRVLVQDGGVIVGYIVVKELFCNLSKYLGLDGAMSPKQYCVLDLPRHHIEHFAKGTSVLSALNALQVGHSRLGVVTVDGSASGTVVGYFSMEDVLEEIIQEEIEDEKDVRLMAVQLLKAGRTPSWGIERHTGA